MRITLKRILLILSIVVTLPVVVSSVYVIGVNAEELEPVHQDIQPQVTSTGYKTDNILDILTIDPIRDVTKVSASSSSRVDIIADTEHEVLNVTVTKNSSDLLHVNTIPFSSCVRSTEVDTIFGGVPVYDNPTMLGTGTLVDVSNAFKYHHKSLKDWYMNCFTSIDGITEGVKANVGGMVIKNGCAFDSSGRIMVGVGPGIMNPDRKSDSAPKYSEMKYGSKIDIVLEKNGDRYYIPAVVADCKAHTYPTWVVQTGYTLKDGALYYTNAGQADNYSVPTEYSKQKADNHCYGSACIEFVHVSHISEKNDYTIVGVVVYD